MNGNAKKKKSGLIDSNTFCFPILTRSCDVRVCVFAFMLWVEDVNNTTCYEHVEYCVIRTERTWISSRPTCQSLPACHVCSPVAAFVHCCVAYVYRRRGQVSTILIKLQSKCLTLPRSRSAIPNTSVWWYCTPLYCIWQLNVYFLLKHNKMWH